ncbi:DNA-formamidopyrimidine glycosylase family protein [Arthrobacter sp. FW306-2-2C-D06B]|uniref:DNA-formamidopyrimidine glycosylase family protein n=1 Tax=Arthrobacter sp. FW306-2-2C-D06B TaxID=2879618 RepID=UPI001F35D0CC|nr:DNA-formamidopyrimidine glycosylase family protein [Arthrobacter sp. FW306-2-2C-D06B]UKA60265.1 Fpg/Nei family DNA glycosylase [Arthrobacter sp. FW306-2-2C-D06B]
MPELPEITALSDFLDGQLSGARLTQLLLPSAFALKVADVPHESLIGRTVESVGRRGKFLVFEIAPAAPEGGDLAEPLYLIVSFAKAGWLTISDKQSGNEATAAGEYFAAQLGFSNHGSDFGITLTDTGTWKGLAIFIVRQLEEIHGLAELGPDPLDPAFGLDEFSRLFTHRQQIKGILRNQKLMAGIGNAYSDEILHAAKLSPVAAASSLGPDAVERLFTTMQDILNGAIKEFSGKKPDELKPAKKASMRVHGRTGEPCPVCGDTVREVAFVGTSLQYCPTCQTNGEILAKRGSSDDA